MRDGNAGMACGGERGERVVAIVFAEQFPLQHTLHFAMQCHAVIRIYLPAIIRAETLYRRPASAR